MDADFFIIFREYGFHYFVCLFQDQAAAVSRSNPSQQQDMLDIIKKAIVRNGISKVASYAPENLGCPFSSACKQILDVLSFSAGVRVSSRSMPAAGASFMTASWEKYFTPHP